MDMRLGDLRRGWLFHYGGRRWKVVHGNECRVYAELLGGKVVDIKGRKFRTEKYENFAPNTIVSVERRTK